MTDWTTFLSLFTIIDPNIGRRYGMNYLNSKKSKNIFISTVRTINPIKVKPGPGRPGLNEKSCQIDMNRLNLFSIGDFSSWSLLYPLKKLFLQYHHKNFEKSGPKVRWLPLELGKKHELTSVSPHLITYEGTNWV